MAGRHSNATPSTPAGHSHSHGHDAPDLHVARLPKTILLVFLALCGIATVVGAVDIHPSPADRPTATFAAPGITFPKAEVLKVIPTCPKASPDNSDSSSGDAGEQCSELRIRVTTGASKGKVASIQVSPQVAASGLSKGDAIELQRNPASSETPVQLAFFGVPRSHAVLILALLLVLVVGAVARLRGLLALVGLGISGTIVWKLMIPSLLEGHSGVAVALVGSSAIMFVVLYLAHGPSLRTSAALAGTLTGVLATTLIASVALTAGRLSGVSDDASGLLSNQGLTLDFQGLLMCAIIVASLGVLNDVTITQASAVWELRAAAPHLSRRALFTSAMRIGRDHIASTIYTIVFAYTGTAVATLLLVQLYDRSLLSLLSSEDIGEEVMRTLSGSIGLVLAVPLTTLIAVLTVAHARPAADPAADRAVG